MVTFFIGISVLNVVWLFCTIFMLKQEKNALQKIVEQFSVAMCAKSAVDKADAEAKLEMQRIQMKYLQNVQEENKRIIKTDTGKEVVLTDEWELI